MYTDEEPRNQRGRFCPFLSKSETEDGPIPPRYRVVETVRVEEEGLEVNRKKVEEDPPGVVRKEASK